MNELSLQRITLQTKRGSGEVAGEQVMIAKPEEQTVARQSAGTVVKSPSASAHGFKDFPSTTERRTPMGADEYAPAFFRRIEEIEAELNREMAQVRLSAIRRECERANKEKERADALETQLAAMHQDYTILKGIASMLLIGYPVLWLVTR